MRRVVLIALFAVGVFAVKAQPKKLWGPTDADSVKCWENYNIAGSYYQNKSYAEAYDAWYQLYTTCPGAKENTFLIAPKVIEAKIKKETDEAKKREYIKILIEQYDVRLQFFPEKEGYVKSEKAQKYLKYNKDSTEQAYNLFQIAFEAAGSDMYPSQLNAYFISAVRMFKDDKIDFDQLLDIYNFITDALDENITKYGNEAIKYRTLQDSSQCDSKCEKKLARTMKIINGYDKVQSNIEKMLAPTLTCDKLNIVVSEEKFDANKGDARWLRTALRMLEKEKQDDEGNISDCTDNPMYFKIAEALYALEPSAQAARSIGIDALKKKQYSNAAKYFDEAIAREEDPRAKARDYLKNSVVYQKLGNLSKAKSYALKSADLIRNSGDAYLVLASIYADAAGTCGSNAIEKNAVYWAAIDKLNYAKSIDPNIASRANRLISAYKKAVPQKSTAFALGYKEGDKYTIGCWINETVVIKFY